MKVGFEFNQLLILPSRLFFLAYLVLTLACGGGNETNDAIAEQTTRPFVTIWKTDNPGFSDDNQIKISTYGLGYDYDIEWGDGSSDKNVTGDITHTYNTPGTYTIQIRGDFPRIVFHPSHIFNEENDALKILSIEQWGDIKWQSMRNAFSRCYNLVGNASDKPDLSQVESLSGMFAYTQFNQNINDWNVASIDSMSGMFNGNEQFNQPLDEWNLVKVTSISAMFAGAISFNQDINNWDVSKVENMGAIFNGAKAFNQPLSNWDMSSVTTTSFMFKEAESFNQPLGNWNVSSVTRMNEMFSGAQNFNQDINNWDVSNVEQMSGMFLNASQFNQDIGQWEVSKVTTMWSMFEGAQNFDQNLSSWNISSIIQMEQMFDNTQLSTSNYDALLLGWSVQSLQSNVVFSAGGSQYSISFQSARDVLTDVYGWTVTDGGVTQP